jgi:nucleolar protein 56
MTIDKRMFKRTFQSSEWYGYHFPELIRIIPDNYTYARVVHLMKNRKEFANDREEELEAITMDSGKTAAVFEAMKTTIGE